MDDKISKIGKADRIAGIEKGIRFSGLGMSIQRFPKTQNAQCEQSRPAAR